MPWLQEVVPFERFRGRDVLEVGCGVGFDAYKFLQSGARYVGVDITPENIERTRVHLGLVGIEPVELEEASAEHLPFPDASFDVVYSNGVLHHLAEPSVGFREVRRVLRSGGRAWVIVYNRDSVFYWFNLVFCRYLLGGGFRRGSLQDRISEVEFTTSSARPVVHLFTRSTLASELRSAGLTVERLRIRKFTHEDVPDAGPLTRLWRRVPQRWLDVVGSRLGWYLIARVRRP